MHSRPSLYDWALEHFYHLSFRPIIIKRSIDSERSFSNVWRTIACRTFKRTKKDRARSFVIRSEHCNTEHNPCRSSRHPNVRTIRSIAFNVQTTLILFCYGFVIGLQLVKQIHNIPTCQNVDLLRDLSQVHNKSKEQSLGFDLLWTSAHESTASLQVHNIQVLQHALPQSIKIEELASLDITC